MARRIPWLLLMLECLAGSGLAMADDARVITGSVGITSDFVYRGLSLTRGKPTAQASLDVEFANALYAGGFVAGTDPNPGPSPAVELDVWLGKYWRIGDDISLDVRLSQYTYPDDPRRVNYNRGEITGTVGYRDRLHAALVYSPNTRAVGSSPGVAEGDVWAAELSLRQPLGSRFTLAAGAGHYALADVYGDDYLYWNLTLIGHFDPIELQVAWLGMDGMGPPVFTADSTGNRLAVTALWRFSNSR